MRFKALVIFVAMLTCAPGSIALPSTRHEIVGAGGDGVGEMQPFLWMRLMARSASR